MGARPVIIDCDPGQDDAVALFLAMASPAEIDLLGITTVAGNVPLNLTSKNARQMCDIADQKDIRVFAGCEAPLCRPLVTAEHVHGRTGIDGLAPAEPKTPLQSQHAVEFIIDILRSRQGVTLVAVGPLTNIATAFQRAPELIDRVAELVIMGGAMREGGNISPSAEFNILVDPDAADLVLRCGRPITMFGLDVTHQVMSTRARVDKILRLNNSVSEAVAGMLNFFHRFDSAKYGEEGAPLHDPCTVAYLLQPELFTAKRCNVSVETVSELTLGHTAVDFWHVTDRPHNVNWVYAANAEGFFSLLIERLATFGEL